MLFRSVDIDGGINSMTATYLNRLSDLLFILARYSNRHHGDVLWQPGEHGSKVVE